MKKKEYYKDYVNNLKNLTQDFKVFEKSIKLRKFLQITRASEDRFLEAKVNISMSYNFMKDCLVSVCFKEIEETIAIAFADHEIIGRNPSGERNWHPTILNYGYYDFHPFEKTPHYFKVKNIISKAEARNENKLILDYWNTLVIPFFNHFTHLYDLIPYIQEDSELNKRLNPNGSFQRKLCIWYLCNHPEYENYKNKVLNGLANPQNDGRVERWRLATIQIIESMEARDPLYLWDEKYLTKKTIPSIVKEFNLDNYKVKEKSKWNISRLWNRK